MAKKKQKLYIVRLWDRFDGWVDVSDPLPHDKAKELWKEQTKNGTKNTKYEDGDYYAIFPSDTKMIWTPERMGR